MSYLTPHRDLMAEARHEREVADSVEATALQEAILKAVMAYSNFLENHGLIWEFNVNPDDPDCPRMKAQALVITLDYGLCRGVDMALKGGALDRVYGNGLNPDPFGFGPPDIPHKKRSEE